MKYGILASSFILLSLLSLVADAQVSKACIAIGGAKNDFGYAVHQTDDEGYVAVGYANSYSSVGPDFYIVKFDADFNMQWSKNYGGGNTDAAFAGDQTADGGYFFAGYTTSFSFYNKMYLCKLDEEGNFEWGETIGGSFADYALAAQQTSDEGYVLAGQTNNSNYPHFDFSIVKVDSDGGLQWSKTIGGTGESTANAVQQTTDHGYVLAGVTNGFGAGGSDMYVVKLNSTGSLEWTRTIGSTGNEVGYAITQVANGGYAIAGTTDFLGAGSFDIYLAKLDASGELEWTRTYGGNNADYPAAIRVTNDGGMVIGGYSASFNIGGFDVYVVKVNASGDVEWTSASGSSSSDMGYSIEQTSDNGFVIGGYTQSFGEGFNDLLLVKLDATGGSCLPIFSSADTSSGGTASSGGTITDVIPIITSEALNDSSNGGVITDSCIVFTNVYSLQLPKEISVFPNPNAGEFTISLPAHLSATSLTVTDVAGRIIFQKEISNLQHEKSIQISLPEEISGGIYFLKVNAAQEKFSRALIVCKE